MAKRSHHPQCWRFLSFTYLNLINRPHSKLRSLSTYGVNPRACKCNGFKTVFSYEKNNFFLFLILDYEFRTKNVNKSQLMRLHGVKVTWFIYFDLITMQLVSFYFKNRNSSGFTVVYMRITNIWKICLLSWQLFDKKCTFSMINLLI